MKEGSLVTHRKGCRTPSYALMGSRTIVKSERLLL